MLQSPDLEEPHVKLFIIDMINFYLSLLNSEDRATLLVDLYEQ